MEEKIISQIISEHSTPEDSQTSVYTEEIKAHIAKQLLKINPQKQEDETNYHFEERVYSQVKHILNEENIQKEQEKIVIK